MDGDLDLVRTPLAVGGGVALGTPTYMAPEPAMGKADLDARRRRGRGVAVLVVAALLLAGFAPAQGQDAGEPLVVGHRYRTPP